MTPTSLRQMIEKRRIIITCGTGGVGKTTVSAALALEASRMGRKAVVITIDPAKRLKTSLGIDDIGNDPVDLSHHLPEGTLDQGQFFAVIPDTRKTFEQMVFDLSPNKQSADRLIENPIFDIIAKEFSGANEYMALQKLASIMKDNRFDTIILDTPPSRNTIAFLNAPRLLGRFFEEKIFQMMIQPTQNLLSKGLKVALDLLSKLTGQHFMTHLMGFLVSIFEMQKSFTKRLTEMNQTLSSSELGFILVTSPSPSTVPDIKDFSNLLAERKYYFDGVILNRTLSFLKEHSFSSENQNEEMGQSLIESYLNREKQIESKMNDLPGSDRRFFERLPELSRDVHSIGDLLYVADFFTRD